MKKLISLAVTASALLVGASIPSNAASLLNVADSGAVTTDPQALPTLLSGTIGGQPTSTIALVYTTDNVEFEVLPPPATVSATVTVDVLAGTLYPNETWRVCSDVTCSMGIAGSGAADNSGHLVSLAAGTSGEDYFLEFASDAPAPGTIGKSQWNVTVPGGGQQTPLPGAIALFLGGLGVLGLVGRRKRGAGRVSLA